MQVRIFRQAKSAMQSGRGKMKQWHVEPVLTAPRTLDSVMGWTSAGDSLNELRYQLRFASEAEAVAFAEKKGWSYEVEQPAERKISPRNYMDNFKPKTVQKEDRA